MDPKAEWLALTIIKRPMGSAVRLAAALAKGSDDKARFRGRITDLAAEVGISRNAISKPLDELARLKLLTIHSRYLGKCDLQLCLPSPADDPMIDGKSYREIHVDVLGVSPNGRTVAIVIEAPTEVLKIVTSRNAAKRIARVLHIPEPAEPPHEPAGLDQPEMAIG